MEKLAPYQEKERFKEDLIRIHQKNTEQLLRTHSLTRKNFMQSKEPQPAFLHKESLQVNNKKFHHQFKLSSSAYLSMSKLFSQKVIRDNFTTTLHSNRTATSGNLSKVLPYHLRRRGKQPKPRNSNDFHFDFLFIVIFHIDINY